MSDVTLLRLPQVEKRIGYRRSRIYELVRNGLFPAPVPLGGGRAVGWISTEIDDYIADQIAAARGGAIRDASLRGPK